MRQYFILALITLSLVTFVSCGKDRDLITVVPSDKVELGRRLFFDPSLSNPVGQSCASCHSPETGFSDPSHRIVSEGAVKGLFSNRNAPSIAYSMFSFPLQMDPGDSSYSGGFFLDGHANSLEEQAKLPLFNPLEMNNVNHAMLVNKLQQAPYYSLFTTVYGNQSDSNRIIANMADAIATFERSSMVNPFSSKFDDYLKGRAVLSDQEKRGMQLFIDPAKGNCAACHVTDPDPFSGKILFTDFTYDNIGVPKNPANPFYKLSAAFNSAGSAFMDAGLGKTTGMNANDGQFKVPSLRNAEISAPYFHNGFFNTLEEVVHFYNARDVDNFPRAEYPANMNRRELGNLKLTAQEEKDIVAFIKTLTDKPR